jgi:hypothetical protein
MAVSAYLVKRRPRCRRSYQSDEDDGVHCDDHHSRYRGRCDAHPDHSQNNPHSAEEERADMSTPGQPPHRPPCPYAPARYYGDHDAGTDGPPADWRIANGVVHYAWEAASAAEYDQATDDEEPPEEHPCGALDPQHQARDPERTRNWSRRRGPRTRSQAP